MNTDRSELHDLAARHPDRVAGMAALYEAWATRCNVLPWEDVKRIRQEKRR